MDTCNHAPLNLPEMQDHQLLTLHWRSFSGWGRERLSTCLLHQGCQYIRKWQCSTIVNILQLTVGYLNATINRKTRNARPEIGPTRSSQSGRNLQVDGFRARSGPPWNSGSGLRTVLEPNLTVFPVQTPTAAGFPGPVANTPQSILWTLYYWLIVQMWMRKRDERWRWEEIRESNMRNRAMRDFDVHVNSPFAMVYVYDGMRCFVPWSGVLYVQLGRKYPLFAISPGISPYNSTHDSLYLVLLDQSTITTQYEWNLSFVISSCHNH